MLGGFPVWIADTAGLREAADAIEAEGVRRALERAEEADLRIGVVEAAGGGSDRRFAWRSGPSDILVRSKVDLYGPPASHAGQRRSCRRDAGRFRISAPSPGVGLPSWRRLLAARVADALGREEAPALTRARHRRLVEEARAALHAGGSGACGTARNWRRKTCALAAAALGRLTGRIDVEDLLDEIFSSFCIGK